MLITEKVSQIRSFFRREKEGIIIVVFEILLTLYTGFKYVTKEKFVEIDDFEITTDKTNRADWSPMVGSTVIVVGGMIVVVGGKEK